MRWRGLRFGAAQTGAARRGAALVALALLGAATLAACGAEEPGGPRALTTEESQLLAIARFHNFDVGTRTVTVTLTDSGHQLELDGWYDFRQDLGYGALSDGGVPNSLLAWQVHTLAVHAAAGGDAPLPPPDADAIPGAAWETGPLASSASSLHAALTLVGELGTDRPENPLLLQQSGALWLRDDEAGGVAVSVFSGPTGTATADAAPAGTSHFEYWVAADGTLMRVVALLGGGTVTVDFGDAEGVALDFAVTAWDDGAEASAPGPSPSEGGA